MKSNNPKRKFPRVMIILDTNRLSGPGKGLLQFLRSIGDLNYRLFCFWYGPKKDYEFFTEATKQGIDIRFFTQRFKFDPTPIIQMIREAEKDEFNIVQTHGYKADVLGFLGKKMKKLYWVSFAHGYTAENVKVMLYNKLDKLLLRGADRVIAVSEAVKETLVRCGGNGDRIRVIHNAVDRDDYPDHGESCDIRKKHGLHPEWPLIGVVGRLSPEKGQIYFLKAVEMMLKETPDFQAILIGEGQDEANLREYIINHGLGKNVKIVGYQRDMLAWYRALDLLVLPSLSEGLPNVVLEAMLFNVPVIATDIGGVSYIINNENGVLIPPARPDLMSKEMSGLLANPDKRKSMGLRGKESLFPKFSVSERTGAILSVYQELLG